MSAPDVRVVGVDGASCNYTLTTPVRFGRAVYAVRDYTLLRLRTDAGIDGFAVGMGRGTPLTAALRMIAPQVAGVDALRRAAVLDDLNAATVPGRTGLVRAHSLVDLALADVAAKAAGLPLHQMLGGFRERIPALAVAGYLIETRGEDAIVDELVGLREQGFRHAKLMIGIRDAAWTRAFVGRCAEALGEDVGLALDLHYSAPSVAAAVAIGQALDEVGAAFFEDPFPPTRPRHYAALRERVATPLAAGEDVTDAAQYADLLEAVDVLRVDPSSAGGLGPVVQGIALAQTAGARVLPHGFPQLNAQLAGAFPGIDWAEVNAPLENGDGLGALFVSNGFTIKNGDVVLDREPGNGIRLDWERVVATAAETWTVSA